MKQPQEPGALYQPTISVDKFWPAVTKSVNAITM